MRYIKALFLLILICILAFMTLCVYPIIGITVVGLYVLYMILGIIAQNMGW
jgi:hypothetical protein